MTRETYSRHEVLGLLTILASQHLLDSSTSDIMREAEKFLDNPNNRRSANSVALFFQMAEM